MGTAQSGKPDGSEHLWENLQGFMPKVVELTFPKMKIHQKGFTAHAGSNDVARAIWAYVSINNILTKHKDRII